MLDICRLACFARAEGMVIHMSKEENIRVQTLGGSISEARDWDRLGEVFEICEYGRRPDKKELVRLFPFFGE